MSIATLFLVFVIVWWMVFFAALPFGVRSQHEDPDGIVEGTDPGAPVNPQLGKKALWTTGISVVLTALYYWIAVSGLLTLDPT